MSHDPYRPETWVDLALERPFPDLEDSMTYKMTAVSLPCDTYECADRLWCIVRKMCKANQESSREEYPDNGPTDPWQTSGPKDFAP